METNDEKRRMSGILRGAYDTCDDGYHVWLNGTLFGLDICAKTEEMLRSGFRHIADLIDPGEERTCFVHDQNYWGDDYSFWTCSECGETIITDYYDAPKYCSSCGAKVVWSND